MKKLIIILMVLFAGIAFGQDGPGVQSDKKFKNPRINSNVPVVVTGSELNALDNITGNVKELIDSAFVEIAAKVDTLDTVDASTLYYLKTETDSLIEESFLPNWLGVIQYFGSGVKAIPAATSTLMNNSATLVDGQIYGVLIQILKPVTITGVGFSVGTPQANYTSGTDYNGFVLKSLSTPDLVEVTRTVNDGNLWKGAAFSTTNKAFPSPVVLQPGKYALEFVYNCEGTATQTPLMMQFGGTGALHSSLFTNGVRLTYTIASPNADITGTTTLTSPTQATTGVTQAVWLY